MTPLRQQLLRSLAEEGVKPTLVVTDALIDIELERHAWLSDAAAKVRRWRAEDEREGQPWNGDVA